jgi:hypothetical protein
MMKEKLFGMIILLVAVMLVFSLAGCGDDGGGGNGGPQTVTYTGTNGNDNYTLKITENASRAAYSPKEDDEYELTVVTTSSTKKSTGTVVSVGGLTITLEPSNSTGELTVTVSGNGLNSITVSAGTVNWDDGSSFTAPGTLTPEKPGDDHGLDWPPDARFSQVGLGGLSNPGVTDLNWTFDQDESGAGMVMYFGGNGNTKNNILSYLGNKLWEYTEDEELSPGKHEYHYVSSSYNIFFVWTTWSATVSGGEITAVAHW